MKKILGTFLASLLIMTLSTVNAHANEPMLISEEVTPTSMVTSLTISSTDNETINWTVNGSSELGFKVVWSKTSGPTYPTRSTDQYAYYSDFGTTTGEISGFDGAGTYYVRVCEYLGGTCGTYSNEITVELEAAELEVTPIKAEEEAEMNEFSDIDDTNENKEAIYYLKSAGVVNGYPDGSYKPYQAINRAEFLKILMEVYGYDLTEGKGLCFKDVIDDWYAPYVCAAKDMGLVQGYGDGYFRPEQPINFVEASKIVVTALSLEIDETNDAVWYEKYVKSLEMVAAIPATVESFDQHISRGEMAEMVWRVETKNMNKESNSYGMLNEEQEMEMKQEMEQEMKMEQSGVENKVTSIETQSNGGTTVSWESEGYSEQGFKVVWSKTSGATYPTRSTDKYAYYSDSATTTGEISAFDGAGTYYVRVCEYLGGSCGVYSNEITVEL